MSAVPQPRFSWAERIRALSSSWHHSCFVDAHMGPHIGIIMGGWGEEKEISIKTGEAVLTALESLGHRATRLFAGPGLDRALRNATVDVAFVALHGRMGEDGRVQGLLEVLEVPYTGSGVLASALGMNKPFAKKLFRLRNLATPTGYVIAQEDLPHLFDRHGDLGFPCVVKPANGGSSVGLTLVRQSSELGPACARAMSFGGSALVERWVPGREVTVGIVADQVLGTCEIEHDGETFDFAHKYSPGSRYYLPARLSPERLANIEAMALAAYESLGCRGYGRVDLLVSDEDNDVVLEVNTLPGLTPMSLLPKIAARRGISFPGLVERILTLATRDEVQTPAAPEEPASLGIRATG